jgi:hypothetical protein
MTAADDVDVVRRMVAPEDPLRSRPVTDAELAEVRARVRAPGGRRRWSVPVGLAAAVVLVTAMVLPLALPATSWAVEDVPDGGASLRVELPGFWERGPEPGPIVRALEERGVEVEVATSTDLRPWRVGRLTGVEWQVPGIPERWRGVFDGAPFDPHPDDLAELGLREEVDGTLTVLPDRFEGTIVLTVGDAPW